MSSNKRKFSIIHSDTPKSIEIYKKVKNIVSVVDISDGPDALIVIGGDGEMLHSLHKYHHLNIDFIGLNAGSIGFLMNKSISKELFFEENVVNIVVLHPLEMTSSDIYGTKDVKLAFNEVSIYRSTNQASKISININDIQQIDELVSDGIIISTPAGSSAYNFSAGGMIVPLESKVICMTPICPFRPRRWRGAILPESAVIRLEVLEHEKRPANAVADFNELENVVNITIRQQNKISVRLLFSKNSALNDRMIKEQFMV